MSKLDPKQAVHTVDYSDQLDDDHVKQVVAALRAKTRRNLRVLQQQKQPQPSKPKPPQRQTQDAPEPSLFQGCQPQCHPLPLLTSSTLEAPVCCQPQTVQTPTTTTPAISPSYSNTSMTSMTNENRHPNGGFVVTKQRLDSKWITHSQAAPTEPSNTTTTAMPLEQSLVHAAATWFLSWSGTCVSTLHDTKLPTASSSCANTFPEDGLLLCDNEDDESFLLEQERQEEEEEDESTDHSQSTREKQGKQAGRYKSKTKMAALLDNDLLPPTHAAAPSFSFSDPWEDHHDDDDDDDDKDEEDTSSRRTPESLPVTAQSFSFSNPDQDVMPDTSGVNTSWSSLFQSPPKRSSPIRSTHKTVGPPRLQSRPETTDDENDKEEEDVSVEDSTTLGSILTPSSAEY